MLTIPFHREGENGDFYAVAVCPCTYDPAKNRISAVAGIYFSPSSDFSRFSAHVLDSSGHCVLYRRGPDYNGSAEAALVNFWDGLPIPVFAWRLFPRAKIGAFFGPDHASLYEEARAEFCRVAYFNRGLGHFGNPFVGPTGERFSALPVLEVNEESSELLAAVLASRA